MASPGQQSVKKSVEKTPRKGKDEEKENRKPASGHHHQRYRNSYNRAPPGQTTPGKGSDHEREPLERHHRGQPSGHRGQPSGHWGQHSGHWGQHSGYRHRGEPSGHRGQPSGYHHWGQPSGHRGQPSRYHHQPAERHHQPSGRQHQPSGRQHRRAGLVEDDVKEQWTRNQLELKQKHVPEDSGRVRAMVEAVTRKDRQQTFYVGGVDISFIKGNSVDACAALVILAYPSLEVVYKRLEMIRLTAPYIPGFLAFREVDSLERLYKGMLKNAPQFKPDVMIVDGNGVLHPRRFGLACHFGVLLDIPCVGVAKTLMHVDGIKVNQKHREKISRLVKAGDTFPLVTHTGRETLGMALRSTDHARTPIYVSQGHRVSLQSAVALVRACCKYRIPEPTRQADLLSRQYVEHKKHKPEEWMKTLESRAPRPK